MVGEVYRTTEDGVNQLAIDTSIHSCDWLAVGVNDCLDVVVEKLLVHNPFCAVLVCSRQCAFHCEQSRIGYAITGARSYICFDGSCSGLCQDPLRLAGSGTIDDCIFQSANHCFCDVCSQSLLEDIQSHVLNDQRYCNGYFQLVVCEYYRTGHIHLLGIAACAFCQPYCGRLCSRYRNLHAALVCGACYLCQDVAVALHQLNDTVHDRGRDHRANIGCGGLVVCAVLHLDRGALQNVVHECLAVFHIAIILNCSVLHHSNRSFACALQRVQICLLTCEHIPSCIQVIDFFGLCFECIVVTCFDCRLSRCKQVISEFLVLFMILKHFSFLL